MVLMIMIKPEPHLQDTGSLWEIVQCLFFFGRFFPGEGNMKLNTPHKKNLFVYFWRFFFEPKFPRGFPEHGRFLHREFLQDEKAVYPSPPPPRTALPPAPRTDDYHPPLRGQRGHRR